MYRMTEYIKSLLKTNSKKTHTSSVTTSKIAISKNRRRIFNVYIASAIQWVQSFIIVLKPLCPYHVCGWSTHISVHYLKKPNRICIFVLRSNCVYFAFKHVWHDSCNSQMLTSIPSILPTDFILLFIPGWLVLQIFMWSSLLVEIDLVPRIHFHYI